MVERNQVALTVVNDAGCVGNTENVNLTYSYYDIVSNADACLDLCSLHEADFCKIQIMFDQHYFCSLFIDEEPHNVVFNNPGGACFVRGLTPPRVDCTVTSNCNTQLTPCGGLLPSTSFNKDNLLQCLPNAESIEFDSRVFIKKETPEGDFFYQQEDKTFMNGFIK